LAKQILSIRRSSFITALFLVACSGSGNPEGEETVGRSQAALTSICSASTPVSNLKELMLVDPSVVNSPEAANTTGANGGELSFRRTMTTLAAGQNVADFTERFFNNWKTTQTVSRGVTEARSGIESLLNPSSGLWRRLSTGKLDMANAPFRLLAVVNRMDLLGTASTKPNGEGRLVYGLFSPGDATNDPAKGNGQPLTVIFEFNLPTTHGLRDWASRWHALKDQPFGVTSTGMGSANFNKILFSNVVGEFVAAQNLSQVRTNEVFFGPTWQLREFNLVSGSLVPVTTKQSPEPTLNDSAELINWVKANKNAILSNTHTVPSNLLGGTSNEGFPRFCTGPGCDSGPDRFDNTRWLINSAATSGIEEPVRFAFANQTCNGCHNSDPSAGAGQNQSLQSFYQVAPTLGVIGTDGSGRLSDFVKNQELPARAKVLSGLLSCNCIASYTVNNSWENGTNSTVKITNIGSSAVSSWNVKWKYGSSENVTSNWDSVKVAGVSAPNVEFKNVGWNGTLAPGASVNFGLVTSQSGLSPVPAELNATCQ
jgi:hypothetical protein